MQVIIKIWSNSPSVRIPAAVMKSANLSVDSVVDVRAENGRVVIDPVYPKQEVNLEALIAGITEENVHPEINFGSAMSIKGPC